MVKPNVNAENKKERERDPCDFPSFSANNAPFMLGNNAAFMPGSSSSDFQNEMISNNAPFMPANNSPFPPGSSASSKVQNEMIRNSPVLIVNPITSAPDIGPLGSESAGEVTYESVMAAADHSKENVKIEVTRTGSAALGQTGPFIRLLDVAESDEAYFFRVLVPGVSEKLDQFSCSIEADGKVTMKGITLLGERQVCRNSQVFRMISQNMCPPGEFSLSFPLPGPVQNESITSELSMGMFTCIVKKA